MRLWSGGKHKAESIQNMLASNLMEKYPELSELSSCDDHYQWWVNRKGRIRKWLGFI